MSKQVKQFRYYSDSEYASNNFPVGLTREKFLTGDAFEAYMPTVHLGIQAPSGTIFYLNDSTNSIMVGYSGVYEIDVEDLTEITSLRFDADSIQKISDNPGMFIIVDLIYEKEEE